MPLFNFSRGAKEQRNHLPETTFAAPLYFGPELNPTVATCVNKIANTLSSIPMNLYAHTKNGKRLAVGQPLFRVLEHPAYEETATLFYNDLYRQILLTGNGYIYLGRNSRGDIVNFTICDSNKVSVERGANNKKIFTIDGTRYTDRDILHIPYPGAGYNGLKGVSPCQTFKDLIDLDNALIVYIRTYFDNSIGTRYGVEMDVGLQEKYKDLEKAYAAIVPWVNKFVTGSRNAGKIMIPPPGTKLAKYEQPSNAEAELKSLCAMVEREIAFGGFGVPYGIVNPEANKYNSLEQQQNDFLSNCIMPFGNHICQSYEKLLPPDDTALFIQFEYKNLLTTDTKSTIEALKIEVESGLMTPNEARKKLGMEDIGPAGDNLFIPANLMPLTEEVVDAYMAKQKMTIQGEHAPQGDDKA